MTVVILRAILRTMDENEPTLPTDGGIPSERHLKGASPTPSAKPKAGWALTASDGAVGITGRPDPFMMTVVGGCAFLWGAFAVGFVWLAAVLFFVFRKQDLVWHPSFLTRSLVIPPAILAIAFWSAYRGRVRWAIIALLCGGAVVIFAPLLF